MWNLNWLSIGGGRNVAPFEQYFGVVDALLLDHFPHLVPYWLKAKVHLSSVSHSVHDQLTSMSSSACYADYWLPHERHIKETVFWTFVIYIVMTVLVRLWRYGIVEVMWWRPVAQAKRFAFDSLKRIPFVRRKIDSELSKVVAEIEHGLMKPGAEKVVVRRTLPHQGLSQMALKEELKAIKSLEPMDWKRGRVSGAIYHGGDELSKLLTDVYGMFCLSNPLHPDLFPSVRKMEAEVISMVLNMYNAPEESGCGSVTSGGTESIIMAVKAYRDWGKEQRGITQPEMIVPVTAHAAFDKAAAYFNIALRHAPIDPLTMKVDLKQVRRMINPNTIMLVGSAPNYPYGTIDDIEDLSKLALNYGIGLHVDCCLGSFIVPFMEEAGFQLPLFDFRVSGVTSISCDTHKFGFAPKGSSVIMYRSKEWRKYQYFVAEDWLGGIYASPSIAGSRPGALIAACWAALVTVGENGYVGATKKIVSCARTIAEGIKDIDGLKLCGDPQAMVVAFTASKSLDIYAIGDQMTVKGWNLNTLQYPAAIHICCTLLTADYADEFLNDLSGAVEFVRANPKAKKGMGAIYGMAASIPDKRLVVDIAKGYLDVMTKA